MQVTISLPDDVVEELKTIAEAEDRSMSAQARRFITQGMDKEETENRDSDDGVPA